MLSPEVKKKIDEQIAKLEQRDQAILNRAGSINAIHEDIVVIQKIDVMSAKSFLHLDQKGGSDRIRMSYYGRVIKIGDTPTGDEVKEFKKQKLKIGDIVQFNPDSGYSLNVIIPEDMPEIWILSIDNILCVDTGFDPVATARKTTEAKILIEEAQGRRIQQWQTATGGKAGNVTGINQNIKRP